MKEELLHYLWRTKRFDMTNLKTTHGDAIQLFHTGDYNTHAGPDFLNARIRIGETIWVGNIEMHLYASEWLRHGHQEDKSYDNVILHVVLEEDVPILRASGERIPCLEMKPLITKHVATKYLELLHSEYWIPCQNQFLQISEMTRVWWLERLLVERLEQKTALIAQALAQNQQNWEETFYHLLARNFGVQVNTEPFELLAKSTPLLLLAKHKNSLMQIEALLFGQAGLLEEAFEDEYPNQLKKEYAFLQKKYHLIPIRRESWKFARLRPASFPTIRIAQFATLLFQSNHLFSKMLVSISVEEIENMLELKLSNYWLTHYRFDKASKKSKKKLGKSTIHLFIINTIVPFLFLYGKWKSDERYKDRAFALLEQVPAEENQIIERWKQLGMAPDSAYQTQALLQLKKHYCDLKKCLNCAIGNTILQGV